MEAKGSEKGIVQADTQNELEADRLLVENTDVEDTTVSDGHVCLLQSVCLLPQQRKLAQVKLIRDPSVDLGADEAMPLEHPKEFENITGVQVEEGVVSPGDDGVTHIVLANMSGFTMVVEKGHTLGKAFIMNTMSSHGLGSEVEVKQVVLVRDLRTKTEFLNIIV